MKRTVLVLFALTPVLAAALAGCGLTQVAGSVLLGGGGLTLTLMLSLAIVGARAPVKAPRAAASAAKPAVTAVAKAPAKAPAPAPAKAKQKAAVVDVAPEARSPEIEEVAAFFVKAVMKDVSSKGGEPTPDGFADDELAFFAEGENQTMRASDSSPHWHLGLR